MAILEDFKDVVQRLDPKSCHLIVGNGFSRACFDQVFNYTQLLNSADFSKLSPYAKNVFREIVTSDFEKVIHTLNQSAQVAEIYKTNDADFLDNLRTDSDGLRDTLVEAISEHHPENPSALIQNQYITCRRFLSHFSSFFSLNYDLLLYWVLLETKNDIKIPFDDGFRERNDELVWDEDYAGDQNLFFLHGALHIMDLGTRIVKNSWAKTGITLVDQVRDAISRDEFPLFVAEGSSEDKLSKIKNNEYLSFCLKALGKLEGCLFIHGIALSENDEHLSRRIQKSNVTKIFVSIHGDPDTEVNQNTIARAQLLNTYARPKEIRFYAAESTNVWGRHKAR